MPLNLVGVGGCVFCQIETRLGGGGTLGQTKMGTRRERATGCATRCGVGCRTAGGPINQHAAVRTSARRSNLANMNLETSAVPTRVALSRKCKPELIGCVGRAVRAGTILGAVGVEADTLTIPKDANRSFVANARLARAITRRPAGHAPTMSMTEHVPFSLMYLIACFKSSSVASSGLHKWPKSSISCAKTPSMSFGRLSSESRHNNGFRRKPNPLGWRTRGAKYLAGLSGLCGLSRMWRNATTEDFADLAKSGIHMAIPATTFPALLRQASTWQAPSSFGTLTKASNRPST